MRDLAALLLADGRFPAGGHAHSAGIEAAIEDGRVVDEASLACFLSGRLRAGGLVDASLAAATVERLGHVASSASSATLLVLDREAEARVAAPPLRSASRRLGRQLARSASRCWLHPVLADLVTTLPGGAMQPVALGATAAAAGLDATAVAQVSVHHSLSTPAQAAVRLLGLDPFAAVAMIASLAVEADGVVAEAVRAGRGPLDGLPARSEPLVEVASIDHADRPLRMFVT